jgi:hypothetical protein
MNIPERPGIMDDRYSHTVPHSPLSPFDYSQGPPHGDLEAALNHARSILPGSYFDVARSGSYSSGLRPGSPLPRPPHGSNLGPPGFGPVNLGPSGYGPEMYMNADPHYSSQYSIEELIRK